LRIGIPTPIQLQVGRDTQDAAAIAIDEINAKGGVLGRKLQMVVADETESPEQGISAIKKLTDEKVDVFVGGYTSGVTLAQLPHISAAKTLYLGVGAASPAITAKVKTDYENYKYIFRVNPLNSKWLATGVVDFVLNFLGKEKGLKKVAIAGESAKWVQDLVPVLKKGVVDGGMAVPMTEFFDVQTSDFSPLFSKAVSSGAEFLVVILSHASSDVFVKQWYDARVPLPIGGIDVKSQDTDFFTRVGGKSLSEVVYIGFMRAAVTPRTIPFWDSFVKRYKRNPVYTAGGAYDAIHLYAEAVARAKSVEVGAVVKELEKTDFVGTSGRLVFDQTHHNS
jgi:branched-chain amino acid transport system substrate-binding protein